MKGLNSTQRTGSVHVKFNVSKDVASHIQQSVVGNWKRMQDLGIVSVHLDNERLICDNSGLCADMSEVRNTELRHYSQLSYPFNGCTVSNSKPVVDSCPRRSRGGRRSRNSGSRVTRQKHNDPSAHLFTSNELCSDAAVSAVLVQQGIMCKNSDNASQRILQDKEVAALINNEHDLFMSVHNVSALQLPNTNYMSPNVAFDGLSINTLSTKTPCIADVFHPTKPHEVQTAVTFDGVQSNNLPPPSTPFVPKRRKRRKPTGDCSDTVSAKTPTRPAVSSMDHTLLPVHVNSSVEAGSYCTDRQFQLNGFYPQPFETAVFSQYSASTAQLMPLGDAGSLSPTPANYAKLPTERHMMLKDIGMVSVKRNVQSCSDQVLQPSLGLNVLYPPRYQYRQLHQPTFSEACRPKLLNRFSQGTLELSCCNPEIRSALAATGAETAVINCAETLCSSVNSQLHHVSSPLSPERNFCSESNTSTSTLRIKSTEMPSSLSSEGNSLYNSSPVMKSLETASSSSVDMIENAQCSLAVDSVVATMSVSGSSKSVNFVVQSDTVDSNLPLSSSAVLKKHKPDVVNGYHCPSHCTPVEAWRTSHLLVPPAVSQIVNKSNFCLSAGTGDDIDYKHECYTDTVHSSIAEPAPNKEASQVAHTLHSV